MKKTILLLLLLSAPLFSQTAGQTNANSAASVVRYLNNPSCVSGMIWYNSTTNLYYGCPANVATSLGGGDVFLAANNTFTGTLNTFQGALAISPTSTTANQPLSFTQTWNLVGTTFYGLDMAITNTNSSASSFPMRIRVGGSVVFSLDPSGNAIFAGTVQTGGTGGLNITEAAAPSAVAGHTILYGDSTSHRFSMKNNNGSALQVVGITTAGTAGHLAVLDTNGIDVTDGGAVPSGSAGVSSGSIVYDWRPDLTNTTINGVGSFTSATTATTDAPTSTICAGVVANTGTTISTGSGEKVTNAQLLSGKSNTYFAYGRLLQITDTRLWMGISDQAVATIQAASPQNAWNTYSFYYCNDAGATCTVDYTTYQAVTCGTSACTITDTGVTVDTADHKFSIVVNAGNTSVAYSIDGVVKATLTTNIPAANVAMRPAYWETNLLGVNKGLALCGASLSQTW